MLGEKAQSDDFVVFPTVIPIDSLPYRCCAMDRSILGDGSAFTKPIQVAYQAIPCRNLDNVIVASRTTHSPGNDSCPFVGQNKFR